MIVRWMVGMRKISREFIVVNGYKYFDWERDRKNGKEEGYGDGKIGRFF